MKFLRFSQTKLGSSLALPANGLGGSRATFLLVAHFALQNTASNSAEKKNRPREGVSEGGCGGNSARRAQPVPFGYFQTDTAEATSFNFAERKTWRCVLNEVRTYFEQNSE